MYMYLRIRRVTALVACLLLMLGLITPGIALSCEGGGEEEVEFVDGTQKWFVKSAEFHKTPPVDQKRQVTIILESGGPETLTSLKVGKPADFSIVNRNGCEKKYDNGDSCQIEMQFLVTGKPNGDYFPDLELFFQLAAKITTTDIPKGVIP